MSNPAKASDNPGLLAVVPVLGSSFDQGDDVSPIQRLGGVIGRERCQDNPLPAGTQPHGQITIKPRVRVLDPLAPGVPVVNVNGSV